MGEKGRKSNWLHKSSAVNLCSNGLQTREMVKAKVGVSAIRGRRQGGSMVVVKKVNWARGFSGRDEGGSHAHSGKLVLRPKGIWD